MSARDAVLARIRRSLNVAVDTDDARHGVVAARLAGAPRGLVPARGQLPPQERVALFATMAEKVSASLARVADAGAVPAAVADFLRKRNLPASVRAGADPRLAAMPWSDTQLEMTYGAANGSDPVGLSHAISGIAESGTLLLVSGADNPTTISFLPETHVVVIEAGDIVGDYESAWDVVKQRYGPGAMPRTVNLITGPSRSGDIEQTIILGAHGPRRLHIVIVG